MVQEPPTVGTLQPLAQEDRKWAQTEPSSGRTRSEPERKRKPRRSALPPPPPVGDLAQAINNQTLILEALANALINKRPRKQTMNDKLIVFLRTKPPTFAGSSNSLEVDTWLRVIQRKLEPFECQDRDRVLLAAHQLTGTALA